MAQEPLPPTFSVEAEAHLRAKGCLSIYELTRNINFNGWPIFLLNNNETKNEVMSRMDPVGQGPLWSPSNNIYHMTKEESFKYLSESITSKDTRRNEILERGVYPATYLAHTGHHILQLGVKAGQPIISGTIIIPFIGPICTGDKDNFYSFTLVGHGVLKRHRDLSINPIPHGGHAHFINSAGQGERANCFFKVLRLNKSIVVVVVASKDIPEDEWLKLDYGPRYWSVEKRKPIPHLSTKVLRSRVIGPIVDVVASPPPSSNPSEWIRPPARNLGQSLVPLNDIGERESHVNGRAQRARKGGRKDDGWRHYN